MPVWDCIHWLVSNDWLQLKGILASQLCSPSHPCYQRLPNSQVIRRQTLRLSLLIGFADGWLSVLSRIFLHSPCVLGLIVWIPLSIVISPLCSPSNRPRMISLPPRTMKFYSICSHCCIVPRILLHRLHTPLVVPCRFQSLYWSLLLHFPIS